MQAEKSLIYLSCCIGRAGADDAVRRMHDLYASYVWSGYGWRQFGKASLHFTRGSDASAFASGMHFAGSFYCARLLVRLSEKLHTALSALRNLHLACSSWRAPS